MKLQIYGLIIQLIWLAVVILDRGTGLLDMGVELLGLAVTGGFTFFALVLDIWQRKDAANQPKE